MILAGLLLAASLGAAGPSLKAFPNAEGAGADAVGGRGGQVCIVTTLADYHPGAGACEPRVRRDSGEVILPAQPAVPPEEVIPGSLRAAIDAEGPRTVVFQVAGTIELRAPLIVEQPYITIAGQTAPGGGICLKKYGLTVSNTHDVVIQHLRARPGDLAHLEMDALSVSRSQNVIIDHCSTSWAIDEVLSVTGEGTTNITVQWCLISESLHDSWHSKGPHGMGSLIRADGDINFHHNLYAMHNARSPRPGTYGDPSGIRFDFRNNVIYNWGAGAGYTAADPATMNYIANYIKPGPAVKHDPHIAFTVGGETTRIYAAHNVLVDGCKTFRRDWRIIAEEHPLNKLERPMPAAPVTTSSAKRAYEQVLNEAGATLPERDAVDRRIIEDVRLLRGAIINSQEEVGGWPCLDPGEPPEDHDRDGMPDAWETAHGLDPRHSSDHAEDADHDGYTNLEEYLAAIGR